MTDKELPEWAGRQSAAIKAGLKQIARGEEPTPLWQNPKTMARKGKGK